MFTKFVWWFDEHVDVHDPRVAWRVFTTSTRAATR